MTFNSYSEPSHGIINSFSPGFKLWSTNTELINGVKALINAEIFSYVELTPIPGTSVDPFLDCDIPFVIHCPNESNGFNVGDEKLFEKNHTTLSTSLEWCEKLNSDNCIVHPGFGSLNSAIDFFKSFSDSRILIENMPKVGCKNERMLGYNYDEISKLLDIGDFKFCLDFNHVVRAAISLNTNYYYAIEDFMELKPEMFHVADGVLTQEKDYHLNIGTGEYDMAFFYKQILKNHYGKRKLTFETPRKNGLIEESEIDLLKFIEMISLSQ